MNKTTIKNNRLTLFSFCIIFLFSSCVNELDSETSPDAVPGTIPINFTTKVSKADTRVTNTAFEKGDKVGLYAMLPSTPITEKRYIDNLQLECGEKKEVCITLSTRDFALISEEGKCLVHPGSYEIAVGGQQPDERSSRLTGQTVSTLFICKTGNVTEVEY